MSEITWSNIQVRLVDLKPWADNPRLSTKKQAARLLKSFDEFGQVQTIAVSPDFEVYDGHQRLSALLTIHGKDYTVDARQASRALTDDERRKLVIYLHSGAVGSWDWDALSGWNAEQVIGWGMDADALKDWKRDVTALSEMIASESGELDDKYTRNIQAPIYEPKGEKPEIKDLFDDTRTKELIAEIDAAEIPEDEKEFLRIAANRHTVINFKRVAEFYAHSDEKTQDLMENSALVIIDFNKAIELGYVKLAEDIAAQYREDYPDA